MSKITCDLPTEAAEAIGRRLMNRRPSYCPWTDLSTRSGVDLRWHSGRVAHWDRPLGVTIFTEMAVSLLVGRQQNAMRATLTHELIHLERGPVPAHKTRREETRVHQLAAMRLVDPVLFDLCAGYMGRADGKLTRTTYRLLHRVFQVDWRTFDVYRQWRARVTDTTAMERWEQFKPQDLPQWPPAWLDHYSDFPKLAALVGPRVT